MNADVFKKELEVLQEEIESWEFRMAHEGGAPRARGFLEEIESCEYEIERLKEENPKLFVAYINLKRKTDGS